MDDAPRTKRIDGPKSAAAIRPARKNPGLRDSKPDPTKASRAGPQRVRSSSRSGLTAMAPASMGMRTAGPATLAETHRGGVLDRRRMLRAHKSGPPYGTSLRGGHHMDIHSRAAE
ncbi:hypothetical protein [Streptomyces sp. NPDC056723]|uniref:hypothetical protein n=1 Tax=unclassified Streptomyces TaxID=2593676 RepID=UPI0036CD483C